MRLLMLEFHQWQHCAGRSGRGEAAQRATVSGVGSSAKTRARILKWTLRDVRCGKLCQVFWIPATCWMVNNWRAQTVSRIDAEGAEGLSELQVKHAFVYSIVGFMLSTPLHACSDRHWFKDVAPCDVTGFELITTRRARSVFFVFLFCYQGTQVNLCLSYVNRTHGLPRGWTPRSSHLISASHYSQPQVFPSSCVVWFFWYADGAAAVHRAQEAWVSFVDCGKLRRVKQDKCTRSLPLSR